MECARKPQPRAKILRGPSPHHGAPRPADSFEGIAALINQQRDLMVCGEAIDSPAALETIPLVTPDLVASARLSLPSG